MCSWKHEPGVGVSLWALQPQDAPSYMWVLEPWHTDWARQCNMGAARGLSMSDGVRRVWNDVFVSPPVLELFPRCVPKLYPVFLIAVTWLLPWRSAGVSWSWVDLQHLYWRG